MNFYKHIRENFKNKVVLPQGSLAFSCPQNNFHP